MDKRGRVFYLTMQADDSPTSAAWGRKIFFVSSAAPFGALSGRWAGRLGRVWSCFGGFWCFGRLVRLLAGGPPAKTRC